MDCYQPRPRERAQEAVEAYIRDHGLQAHDKLPPERELCEAWGFNRCTLRSALARMTADGRLYTRQGSGTRVAPRFDRTLQDLQSFSEHARSVGLTPESRLLNFSVVAGDRAMAARFGRQTGENLYRVVRLRLLDGEPVLLETAYIPQTLAPGLEEHDLVHGSLFSVLEEAYGLRPDHGWEKTGLTYAAAEEASYLGIQEGASSFWIVSETYAANDTLIEYCRTLGRADVLEMTSTLRWRQT